MTTSHTSHPEPLQSPEYIPPSDDVRSSHEAPASPEESSHLFTPEQVQELIDEALEVGALKLESLYAHGMWGSKIKPRHCQDFASRVRAKKGEWIKKLSQ